MKNLFILFFLVFTLIACDNDNTQQNDDLSVIDIEASLTDFSVIPLSKIADKIRYVKLESNENALITDKIRNIFLEDEKLFVCDEESYLKVFDALSGKYLYNVGSKGQGPGELPFLSYVDINAQTRRILLSYTKITHEFDFDGNFLGTINHPDQDSAKIISYNVTSLNNDLFAAGIQNYADFQEDALVIFNREKQILNTLKSYEAPIKHPQYKTWNPFEESGFFYTIDADVRFYRGICDTIYSYNSKEKKFVPKFRFNFGKHRSNHNHNPDSENNDVIHVKSIVENSSYIFIGLSMKKQAPEPFEDTILWGGQLRSFVNRDVYGVYDKIENKLHYLLQPIPKILGLKNDIDNGVPFWPKSVSSSGEMIDYQQAYKFLEYGSKLSNPDDSFKVMFDSISEDDNPIVIIAK